MDLVALFCLADGVLIETPFAFKPDLDSLISGHLRFVQPRLDHSLLHTHRHTLLKNPAKKQRTHSMSVWVNTCVFVEERDTKKEGQNGGLAIASEADLQKNRVKKG